MQTDSLVRRTLASPPGLALILLLSGCGSISVQSYAAPSFQPASQVWQVETTSGANRHSFILSSVAGYCGKRKKAEADRLSAWDRHTERLASGEGTCDSYDLYLDDVAAAYRPLTRPGARLLAARVDREEAVTWDDRTAPEVGTYNQVGPAEAGRFSGQLLSYGGFVEQDLANAYTCLGPDEVDETNYNEVMAEVDPDLLRSWELSAGQLILNEGENDSWDVEVDGDLMGSESTVGSVEASFTAVRCEVPVTEDTLG